jgi:formamidopyrimidine-DNA glycosylase
MPELPEVETVCQGLKPLVVERTITAVTIIEPRLRWHIPSSLADCLCGQRFYDVRRRGKYLCFAMTKGTIIGHLGMTGSFRLTHPDAIRKKHDHVLFTLDNQSQLRYHDPRRFGSLHWTEEDPAQHRLLCKLGPEPLSAAFSAHYLHSRLQRSQKAVKACLMDHHLVVGVGNIYATEALFLSGVHPQRPAHTVALSECEKLYTHIVARLQAAITMGGTTLKDFVNANDQPGYFQQTLLAYGRQGDACTVCQTTMQSVQVAQRSSVFCPRCQR